MRARAAPIVTLLSVLSACGNGRGTVDSSATARASALRADPAEVEVDVDILPGVYPNQLKADDTVVEIAVDVPRGAGIAHPHDLRVSVSSASAQGAPAVSASSVAWNHGDHGRELLASFPVSDLRAAGLLGPSVTRLRVRIETPRGAAFTGEDRLFDRDAFVLALPRPTGGHPVGTTSSVLFDPTRPGATAAGRELVLRLWYPADSDETQPTTYFLNDREAELNAVAGQLPGGIFDRIHAWSGLDVRPERRAGLPALVLSTGLGVPLTLYSEIAEDLASHGYVVVGVEHPVGSGIVVYPDGSVSDVDPMAFPLDDLNRDWATDLELVGRWVVSQGASGHGPRPPIAPLALVDPARIGVFGHSFGGAASVWAASESPIFRASIDVDGSFLGDMLERAPRTPVLILLSERTFDDPTLGLFSSHDEGPLWILQIAGAGHHNYSDLGTLVTALAALGIQMPDLGVGAIDPGRALAIESAYVRAFFDATLLDQPPSLLDGPSPDFPEVTFLTETPAH